VIDDLNRCTIRLEIVAAERDSQRRAWREIVSQHGIACLTAGMLAASIALGGATRSGYPGDVLLQFLAIILLIAALRDIVISGSARHFK
jgi:hypothetical protein